MRRINVNEVLQMLKSGKTRKEIKKELELSPAEYKLLFSHPTLRNRRTSTADRISIELVEEPVVGDIEDFTVNTATDTINNEGVGLSDNQDLIQEAEVVEQERDYALNQDSYNNQDEYSI